MKGFLKFGALVLVVVLVSGCGSKGKTLKCSMSESVFGMSVDMSLNMTFDGDKMSKVVEDIKYSLPDELKELANIEDMKTEMDADFAEQFKDNKSIKYSSKVKGNEFNATIEFDITKLSADELEKMDFPGDSSLNYKDTKAEFEKAGFTCK